MGKYDNININCIRGDTETKTFTVTQAGTSTAFSLSGYTVTAKIKSHPDNSETLASITVTDGVSGSNFSGGIVVLIIPATTTAILPDLTYYDVQAVNGSTVYTIGKGKITLHGDVNR